MKRVLLVLLFAAVACGKRGDPKPPVPIIPQATTDLVVTQRADKVILSWSYPSITTAGRSLTEVRRITILRYVEPFQDSKIPPVPEAQFVRLSTKVDSIEKANLGDATAGARLLFTDTPPLRSSDGRPVRLTYAVVTEGAVARSTPSNLAVIVPLPVAVPPSAVKATAKAEGVVLTWDESKQSIGDQGAPVIVGYHIYRTAPGQPFDELSAPITTAPVKETTYTDTPPYAEHDYRVAAVASTGPPLLQSDPSAPVRIAFRDLIPPPAPGKVTALVETNLIRLLWDPVTAPDVAGYFVYRWDGGVRLKLCCPTAINQTNFLDISMQLGSPYRYEVTAIDKSGNESAPGSSETITIPKTP